MNDLTIIMLTANLVPKDWAKYHKQKLLEAIGDTPLIVASKKPVDFGLNIIQESYGLANLYKEMLRAAKMAITPFVATADDDTLYPKQHFEFRPPDNNFYYNFNRWHIFTWGEPIYFLKPRPGNGCMIAPRKLLIEAMERRINANPDLPDYFVKELGNSKRMAKYDKAKRIEFYTTEPIVSFYHDFSVDQANRTHAKRMWPVRAYELPLWGRAKDLRRKFKQKLPKSLSFIGRDGWMKPGKNGGVYPVRLTTRVRGRETATFLGALYEEYNKNGKYKNDVHIFIKPKTYDLKGILDGDYVDILDQAYLIQELKKRSKIKVIALSKVQYDYLKKELKNKIYHIPHHHINFENIKRSKNKKLVGGFIGKPTKIAYEMLGNIKSQLEKVGIDFKECFHYQTRQDILDFHNQIDFQVIWFPNQAVVHDQFYRHPTKIANAASFGIPTIAQNILGHQEFEGDYLVAESYEDIAKEAEKLKNDSYYNELSDRLIEKAKKYHISEIAKLYRKLK